MRQLLENPDLKDLNLKPSNHDLKTQAELVRDGQLDLAAVVMNENAALIRTLTTKYDLEIVASRRHRRSGGARQVAAPGQNSGQLLRRQPPIPATDRLVGQVDTLIMTNTCMRRAERLAFLTLLSEEFPSFARNNPPPSAKSQDQAPLSDEAESPNWRTDISPGSWI
jgi:hypothetical protein